MSVTAVETQDFASLYAYNMILLITKFFVLFVFLRGSNLTTTTQTPHETLQAIDFAAFRPLAHEALGMTAHVVYEAIDSQNCATLSPKVIEAIRREIGFKGLLMTDDLSMNALTGHMAGRVTGALAAGCDVVLHCNGNMAEMHEIAAHTPPLAGCGAARAARAEAERGAVEDIDIAAAEARYSELTGEMLHA